MKKFLVLGALSLFCLGGDVFAGGGMSKGVPFFNALGTENNASTPHREVQSTDATPLPNPEANTENNASSPQREDQITVAAALPNTEINVDVNVLLNTGESKNVPFASLRTEQGVSEVSIHGSRDSAISALKEILPYHDLTYIRINIDDDDERQDDFADVLVRVIQHNNNLRGFELRFGWTSDPLTADEMKKIKEAVNKHPRMVFFGGKANLLGAEDESDEEDEIDDLMSFAIVMHYAAFDKCNLKSLSSYWYYNSFRGARMGSNDLPWKDEDIPSFERVLAKKDSPWGKLDFTSEDINFPSVSADEILIGLKFLAPFKHLRSFTVPYCANNPEYIQALVSVIRNNSFLNRFIIRGINDITGLSGDITQALNEHPLLGNSERNYICVERTSANDEDY